jgi:hypothetical protein
MFHITDPEGVLFILIGTAFLLGSIFVANWLAARDKEREDHLHN